TRFSRDWSSDVCSSDLGLGSMIWLFPQLADGAVIRHEVAWLPSMGLNLVFRLDGFSWLFGLLITGVGFLVVLYARYYMSPKDPRSEERRVGKAGDTGWG